MLYEEAISAFVGGAILGLAAALLLVANGRIFGVSGIAFGALARKSGDFAWRLAVLLGLLTGGVALFFYSPKSFDRAAEMPPALLVAAGILVGIGTRLGGGCTSGHGVCGVARFSPRSIVATMLFVAVGILTASTFHHLMGGE